MSPDYTRVFEDNCEPQYCLQELFVITGGSEPKCQKSAKRRVCEANKGCKYTKKSSGTLTGKCEKKEPPNCETSATATTDVKLKAECKKMEKDGCEFTKADKTTQSAAKCEAKKELFTADYINTVGGNYLYYAACDTRKQCPSWDSFIAGFNNRNGRSTHRFMYGTQGNEGKTRTYARKWFFALAFEPRPVVDKVAKNRKIPAGDSLVGRWIPVSSGGQASFSEAIHW